MGVQTLKIEDVKPKKNIATTRSFERNLTELKDIKERITTFAVSCSEKLRQQHSVCTSIMVFIRTNYHREELEQYQNNIILRLPFPTNSSIELAKFANQALELIFKPNFAYKKAGVIIMGFKPEDEIQLSLFENSNPKHHFLMKTIDQINNSLGQQKIKLASQDLKKMWKMKQARLSPRYTTKLSDIIIVKC